MTIDVWSFAIGALVMGLVVMAACIFIMLAEKRDRRKDAPAVKPQQIVPRPPPRGSWHTSPRALDINAPIVMEAPRLWDMDWTAPLPDTVPKVKVRSKFKSASTGEEVVLLELSPGSLVYKEGETVYYDHAEWRVELAIDQQALRLRRLPVG